MFGYLEIIRPKNCLMAAFAVLIGSFLVLKLDLLEVWQPVAFAIGAAFLITGGGNAINDYFDVEADRLNRPNRPIPSERVSVRGALVFSIILFLAGILLAAFTTNLAFGIAIFNSFMLFIYSWSLQHKTFFGNFTVAYLTGSTFLFGGAAVENIQLPLLFGLLAALTTFPREIVKDIEDIEGDSKMFIKKYSYVKKRVMERFTVTDQGVILKYKKKTGLITSAFSLAVATALSPVPYILGLVDFWYLILVIPADIVFLLCILKSARAERTQDFSRISRLIKYGYFLGLLAFLAGILII
ncbi:MAG: UbiA family prenyltransferase [Candidatus Aenigmarchaeota archaeon]|nr:UbiA family prenyltransferase [Candidatus Aenigmarchaeota archaeon]